MFTIRLINPLRQFGYVNWTLTFSDSSKTLPDLRVDKKYPEDASPEEIAANVSESLIAMMADALGPDAEPLSLSGEIVSVDDVGGETYEWPI